MAISFDVVSRRCAVELLTALEFWRMYPFNLGCCRAAVAMIGENKDRVAVILGGKAGQRVFPVMVTGTRFSGRDPVPKLGWQFELPKIVSRAEIIHGFSEVVLIIGEPIMDTPTIVTPVECLIYPDRITVTVSERMLPELHERAERILCPELEKRGMDCSTVVVSGRVCRHVCETIEGLRSCDGPQKVYWPSAAGERLNALHPTDLEAVLQAERILIRLQTQLTSEVEAGDGKSPKAPAKWRGGDENPPKAQADETSEVKPLVGKPEQGEGNGGKGTAEQTTRWERLKKWALNNWLVVAFLAISAVVVSLAALGTGLENIFNWIRRFVALLGQ